MKPTVGMALVYGGLCRHRAVKLAVPAPGGSGAGVVLSRAMPQYTLSDDECTALWTYLLTHEP
ncbi:hypothetical protein [Cupriavidus necator]